MGRLITLLRGRCWGVGKMSEANKYQVGGSHYKSMHVEPWDVIDGCFTKEQAKGYYRGNVIKYVMRAGRKGSEVEDLKKAAHYLEKLIEVLTGEEKNEHEY